MNTFDSEMLKLLVCPQSKADLMLHEGKLVSTDKATRRVYEIVDGIPDMLIDHSRVLDTGEWEQIMQAGGKT